MENNEKKSFFNGAGKKLTTLGAMAIMGASLNAAPKNINQNQTQANKAPQAIEAEVQFNDKDYAKITERQLNEFSADESRQSFIDVKTSDLHHIANSPVGGVNHIPATVNRKYAEMILKSKTANENLGLKFEKLSNLYKAQIFPGWENNKAEALLNDSEAAYKSPEGAAAFKEKYNRPFDTYDHYAAICVRISHYINLKLIANGMVSVGATKEEIKATDPIDYINEEVILIPNGEYNKTEVNQIIWNDFFDKNKTENKDVYKFFGFLKVQDEYDEVNPITSKERINTIKLELAQLEKLATQKQYTKETQKQIDNLIDKIVKQVPNFVGKPEMVKALFYIYTRDLAVNEITKNLIENGYEVDKIKPETYDKVKIKTQNSDATFNVSVGGNITDKISESGINVGIGVGKTNVGAKQRGDYSFGLEYNQDSFKDNPAPQVLFNADGGVTFLKNGELEGTIIPGGVRLGGGIKIGAQFNNDPCFIFGADAGVMFYLNSKTAVGTSIKAIEYIKNHPETKFTWEVIRAETEVKINGRPVKLAGSINYIPALGKVVNTGTNIPTPTTETPGDDSTKDDPTKDPQNPYLPIGTEIPRD